MKNFRVFILLLAAFGLPTWLTGQVTEMPMLPASSITSYANLPIAQLNRAHRERLTGQFEVALLTYNSALAWQPDWVPALTARAELLYRMGRTLEAQQDRMRAQRQNPNATAFFLAKGSNGLMPFLALYPKAWYQLNYGFPLDQPTATATSPQQYFYSQYEVITSAPDTALAVRALQQKLDRDVRSARTTLEALPAGYHAGVRKMLFGNLAMLNHDYDEAINYYTDANLKNGVDWPELHYNRGLGYILLHNYVNGCADLNQASREGFQPATTMLNSLCNF